jgi:hypothetical protein
MQGIAWAGMLVDYSKTDGLAKAAADTFSGEKPCELCCKIAEAKQEGARKNQPGSPDLVALAKLKHEMLPAESLRLKPPFSGELPHLSFPPPTVCPGLVQSAPPVPPPRLV